jgi:polysaccharide chain length determinant protein (PEP-CTERM system associated)
MNGVFDDIRLALHNVWKRRWLALGVAWGLCLAGWLAVSLIPNRFESEAQLFVQTQTLLPDKIGITPAERAREVEQVKRTLASTANLEKVVRGTALAKLAANDRDVADLALSMRDDVKVIEEQENLFKITAASGRAGLSDAENATLARDIVQQLIDIFVRDNVSGGLAETTQTLKFLDQQIAQREVQLREAEGRRVAFEQKYLGLLPGVGSIEQRMIAARTELNQVDSSLITAQSALAAMNSQLGSVPQTVPGAGGGGGPAASRVATLEAQMADGAARGWTDSHPDMIALRNQLARARAAAAAEVRGGGVYGSPNPAYTSLRAMIAERQATVAALSGRKAQLMAEMGQFTARQASEPGVAAEQDRLNQDYAAIKAQYDKLLANREEVRLRGQMQTTTDAVQFRVVSPPSAPRSPALPGRGLLLSGVLALGLMGGIAAAFVLGQLQPGFSTAARLEAASGLPVIATIGEVVTGAQRAVLDKRQRLFAGGTAALFGAFLLLVAVEFVQRAGIA